MQIHFNGTYNYNGPYPYSNNIVNIKNRHTIMNNAVFHGKKKDGGKKIVFVHSTGFEPARTECSDDLKSSPLDHSGTNA